MNLPGPIVSPEWLLDHLDEPGIVLAHVAWEPGMPGAAREGFEAGHIQGAVFFDVDADLAAPAQTGPGRHPLPSSEAFVATMAAAGIGDDTAVVVYDDAQGSYAGRLWWMLDVTGHAAAVLDGGIQGWSRPLEAGPSVAKQPAAFTARPWRVADPTDIARTIRESTGVVLDARAPERYRGEVEPFDSVAGHIPGAVSAPWGDNIDPETGRFLDAEALRKRYAALGVKAASSAIAYCGSGVTATHDLIAMRVAGLGMGRLSEGSWSGWIEDAERPVATGPG